VLSGSIASGINSARRCVRFVTLVDDGQVEGAAGMVLVDDEGGSESVRLSIDKEY